MHGVAAIEGPRGRDIGHLPHRIAKGKRPQRRNRARALTASGDRDRRTVAVQFAADALVCDNPQHGVWPVSQLAKLHTREQACASLTQGRQAEEIQANIQRRVGHGALESSPPFRR